MEKILPSFSLETIQRELEQSLHSFDLAYPGESNERQPVHTVYGGAHLFSPGLPQKLGKIALASLAEYAPNAQTLALAVGHSVQNNALWELVYDRVLQKLDREPIEDFRIDFEDGYGYRSDEEEDGHALNAAEVAAIEWKAGKLPINWGIRIKAFNRACFQRSQRTLRLFISTLLKNTAGKVPSGFVVTLPKVTLAAQTKALSQILSLLEIENGLKSGTFKIEIMVETTQTILNTFGICPLKSFVEGAEGRCLSAHFGSYDYTAGHDVIATSQTMQHPACLFAKQFMKAALASTGVRLSDGATNILPVGPHKSPNSNDQKQENRAAVQHAWKIAFENIRQSLFSGFYQGWDLHPAQLPIRYAAMDVFFLESLAPTTKRLRGFLEKAAQASLMGGTFDDAATGQGLLNFFLRGLSCGALTSAEVSATGLTMTELNSRSFLNIVENRRNQADAS